MSDSDGGDHLLHWVGIILVLFLLISVATLVFVAMSVPQELADAPDTDWTLTRINESYVRITHAGGTPVQTEKLSVTVDGVPRHPQWTATTLTDGEYGVVRVGEASRLTLLWQHSANDRDVLQRWHLSSSASESIIVARPDGNMR